MCRQRLRLRPGRPLVIHLHGDGGNMNLSAGWKSAVLNDTNGAVLLSAQGRNNIPAAAIIDGSALALSDGRGRPGLRRRRLYQ